MGTKKIELTVTKRSEDIHVCKTGSPAEWDCGKTVAEAVGKWVLTHGEAYGINVQIKP